jgi:hypothetical protein
MPLKEFSGNADGNMISRRRIATTVHVFPPWIDLNYSLSIDSPEPHFLRKRVVKVCKTR